MHNRRSVDICLSLAGFALFLLIAGPLFTRLQWLNYRLGLLALVLAVVLALGVLAAVLWMVLRRGSNTPQRRRLVLTAALALPPIVFAIGAIGGARGLPVIHDISTDTHNPPVFVTAPSVRPGAENSLDYDPANAALQQAAYPDIISIATAAAPEQAFQLGLQVARELDWEVYAQDAQQGRIEAVATTPLFGFKDDIVIRVRPAGAGSVVDVRSVSRVGKGDMGANAKRIRRFTELFGKLRS